MAWVLETWEEDEWVEVKKYIYILPALCILLNQVSYLCITWSCCLCLTSSDITFYSMTDLGMDNFGGMNNMDRFNSSGMGRMNGEHFT